MYLRRLPFACVMLLASTPSRCANMCIPKYHLRCLVEMLLHMFTHVTYNNVVLTHLGYEVGGWEEAHLNRVCFLMGKCGAPAHSVGPVAFFTCGFSCISTNLRFFFLTAGVVSGICIVFYWIFNWIDAETAYCYHRALQLVFTL